MPTTPDSMRTRWFMPAFSLFLGALVCGALWIGGDSTSALLCLALFVGVAALFLFWKRNETLQGIGGPGRDERWAMIDMRATVAAASVLLTALTGCWLYELASGRDGSPYGQLMAVGGLAYIAAVAILRWRS